jgi:hypothetical protein
MVIIPQGRQHTPSESPASVLAHSRADPQGIDHCNIIAKAVTARQEPGKRKTKSPLAEELDQVITKLSESLDAAKSHLAKVADSDRSAVTCELLEVCSLTRFARLED